MCLTISPRVIVFSLLVVSPFVSQSSGHLPTLLANHSPSESPTSARLSMSSTSAIIASQYLHAFNVSAHDFIECNGRQYGRPIASSCLDAWRLMPSQDREVVFADRSQEIASDVVLPWRFPSCERLQKCNSLFCSLGVVKNSQSFQLMQDVLLRSNKKQWLVGITHDHWK